MHQSDTRTGGGQEAFPETAEFSRFWEDDVRSAQGRERVGRALSAYWKPVYKFIRAYRGKTIEDAKDLTQEFFCHLLEDGAIATYRPEKGRFRSWLKGVLRNFMLEYDRDRRRLKRGGGKTFVSLDTAHVETERFQADLRTLSPDAIFDQQWRRDVVAEGLRRLQECLENEGKALWYRVFEKYELSSEDPSKLTYESVAGSLGLGRDEVKQALRYARERLRMIVVKIVGSYAGSREEAVEEVKDLLSE